MNAIKTTNVLKLNSDKTIYFRTNNSITEHKQMVTSAGTSAILTLHYTDQSCYNQVFQFYYIKPPSAVLLSTPPPPTKKHLAKHTLLSHLGGGGGFAPRPLLGDQRHCERNTKK